MYYVYELRDTNGATFYVGKGSGRRMYQHKYKAKHGEQTPRAVRIREILARGGNVLPVIVFETSDESLAYTEEVKRIALYGRKVLTNQTDGGCGIRNVTAEAREKIAKCRRGRIASEETRARQRAAKLGTHRTEKTKAKISASQTGTKKPWAREHALANLSKMSFKGRSHTPETIAKMRAAKTGHSVSPETRRKISETKKKRSNT